MVEISIESAATRFEEHLKIEGNFRIIFSGKFGVGKSFFLNKFFDDRKDKYNKFLVSPVNYIVSSNEDIFELIKADIIKDLFLTGKIDLKELPEDNTLQKISNFVENNPTVIGNFMLNTFTKLDPSLAAPKKAIDAIGEIYKRVKKHVVSKKPEDKTRSEELSEYLFETNEKIGNIYEYNYITKLINTYLEELRNEGERKNVLIIDDLDRIDPEHIFRILNVLSTHHNQFREENKFSFDHIVIVCDIENIKRNFEHRYGKGVDFEGYIDKFYSTEIFYFDNKDALKSYVESLFNVDKKDNELGFLTFVLSNLIEQNSLSIRKLLKHSFNISINNFILFEQKGINEDAHYLHSRPDFLGNGNRFFIESGDLIILRFFKLMSIVYGDFNSFFNALMNIKSIRKEFDYFDCKDLISFLALQDHISSKTGDDLFFAKYYDNSSGHKYLANIGFPNILFLQQKFRMNLQWNAGNRYSSNISFFKNAFVTETQSISYMNNKSGILIKASDIFQSVEKIAISCYEKGYLTKAGIYFRKEVE
jgi:KAP family P-loop domain